MSDMEWFALGVAPGILVGAAFMGFLLRVARSGRPRPPGQDRDFSKVAQGDLVEPTEDDEDEFSFHVHIDDWGPDFDGVGGTLTRWRWTVWHANHESRDKVDAAGVMEIGIHMPLFLGNAPTVREAEAAAFRWIRENFGVVPVRSIVRPHGVQV